MRAEIFAIGSELLLGQAIDTNGPWIANKLSEIGIDCHFKTVVGDNLNNIADTFTLALSRTDFIFCTGGLGPTQDDITKDALAKAIDSPLIFDNELATRIREKFHIRNRSMSENNLRQAYYPKGATLLSEHPGTAPGIHYITKDGKHIFLMPGVPSEMKLMMENSVLPYLMLHYAFENHIYTKTIKSWGLPESDVAEKLNAINDELDFQTNPKLSFLASGIEGIQVRLSSKNSSEEEALFLIRPYQKRIEEILGKYVFGHDNDTMEIVIQRLLRKNNLTVGFYETFSRGLAAQRIYSLVDNYDCFKGSIVQDLPNDHDINTLLLQTQIYLKSDIVLSVQKGAIKDQHIELFLYLLYQNETYTKSMIIPYFNHDQTVQFSVINLLDMLRLFLLER